MFSHQLDVRDKDSWPKFIEAIPEDFKNIDVLVNNAGLALTYDLTEQASWVVLPFASDINSLQEDVNTVIDVNVKGLWLAINSVVPGMKARNAGHVINVGRCVERDEVRLTSPSIAGKEAYPKGSIYCASKFAVEAISDSLRKELVGMPLNPSPLLTLRDTDIRVTKISPGLVETEFSVVRLKGDVEAAKIVYNGLTPLNGDDIADNIVYSASRYEEIKIPDQYECKPDTNILLGLGTCKLRIS